MDVNRASTSDTPSALQILLILAPAKCRTRRLSMQGKRNSCVFLSSRRTSVDRFGRLFRLIVSAIVLLTVLGPASAAYGQNYRVFYRLHTRGCCATLTSPMTQGRDGNLYLTNLGGITEGEGFYRITPAGNIDLLYGFNTVALQGPSSAPVLGTDGNFYGSASSGGTYSFGTVYQMTPTGSATVLHDFTGGADGAWPHGLLQGMDGDLYGFSSGLSSGGTIFRITRTGTLTPIYTFPNYPDFPYLLLRDDDGNFYGTVGGGSYPNGMIFKITPAGTLRALYEFDGVHGSSPAAMVQMNGYLLGATFGGGSKGGGTIFKMTPTGVVTVVHEFDKTNPVEGWGPNTLIRASDGKVYGTTLFGGPRLPGEGGTLFRISGDGKFEVLHNFFEPDGYHSNGLRQHTNGIFYGSTGEGGYFHDGVLFRFDMGLQPFVALESTLGSPGSSVGVLGSGFNSTTQVSFNGTPANFQILADTYLVTTVPQGASTGYIKVVTGGGTLKSDRMFTIRR
jgi:uncharacterized repeat protein (TIGR03803 family)